jgi:hypothetical protein
VEFCEAELLQARLAAPLHRLRLLGGTDGGRGGGALPPCRRHPLNLVAVQQLPQGGGRDAKLALDLRQRPCPGDQPVLQVGPHPLEAECGRASGGALLGGALALAGQPLAAGKLSEMMLGDGAADGLLGGSEVGGELEDAPAVIQEGMQASRQVGVAQACGLLVEVAVVGVGDGEAAAED